jgi:hypothetical protein
MPTIINASPTNGLVQTADGSGVLKVQSNGVTTNALAWVNFNGTGTVDIRSSYNVSSITDNGTGDYTVNFATALSDANYSVASSGGGTSGNFCLSVAVANYLAVPSTTALRVVSFYGTSQQDCGRVNVAIFGN